MEDRIPQTVAEYHSEFKKRKGNMCDSPNTVAKKLRLLQKYKSRYTQTIANLKQQVLTLQKQNEELKSELRKLRPSNSIMTPLDNVECKPRGRRYSELQKNFALALHYCSAKCYRLYKLFKNTKERLLKT
uniref:THAP9-like helix-turn-helix domain-containing protein n=1 Tax=Photinus pyralis TaxID=7054 RepID=A0A1Y1LID3_PHOPY